MGLKGVLGLEHRGVGRCVVFNDGAIVMPFIQLHVDITKRLAHYRYRIFVLLLEYPKVVIFIKRL